MDDLRKTVTALMEDSERLCQPGLVVSNPEWRKLVGRWQDVGRAITGPVTIIVSPGVLSQMDALGSEAMTPGQQLPSESAFAPQPIDAEVQFWKDELAKEPEPLGFWTRLRAALWG